MPPLRGYGPHCLLHVSGCALVCRLRFAHRHMLLWSPLIRLRCIAAPLALYLSPGSREIGHRVAVWRPVSGFALLESWGCMLPSSGWHRILSCRSAASR